ncbi:DUF2243 domain-containing protein [Marinococcus halophilus]|uniref:Membrane protein n=1 Tax=Marinococcus halophilus TaxID=1371 RepID=A0A510YA27_MARHA|nr:DUF2243 domain-containing protein [Marinococcus halophilus]OZT78778.1 DUF2243 domain-containing protein [Marinococcus halophilus]GEK60225.1 membrane protein [Marinococcus halophilus]
MSEKNEAMLRRNQKNYAGRNILSGFLFGLGLIAFIDEVVFHQLLHWHHFYDLSTTTAGLISDGFFHAFSWFATVAALFMVADLRRRQSFWLRRWIGGTLTGAGFFQLYDGLVQHKWMGIHQIRYGVDILPYDLVWNISALVILIAGIVVWRQTSQMKKQKETV